MGDHLFKDSVDKDKETFFSEAPFPRRVFPELTSAPQSLRIQQSNPYRLVLGRFSTLSVSLQHFASERPKLQSRPRSEYLDVRGRGSLL